MYETLLGKDGFRKGMDLYFERHDGQAVTTDDFLASMADANECDLTAFKPWYSQAVGGRPWGDGLLAPRTGSESPKPPPRVTRVVSSLDDCFKTSLKHQPIV